VAAKMRRYLTSIPAIIIVSIALPSLVVLLMEWMVSSPYDFDGEVVDVAMYIVFAICAGVMGYFRGNKIWRKVAIFVVVFLAQVIVFFVVFLSRLTPYPPGF
jgi:Na+/glutamate symporter